MKSRRSTIKLSYEENAEIYLANSRGFDANVWRIDVVRIKNVVQNSLHLSRTFKQSL